MKKFLRQRLPGPEIITGNRYLRFLSPWLGHPRLWHLHRRSVALGVAIGLVTGLIPGPVQMLLAVLISIPLRANVLAAVFATLYTNPITFVPLYLLAYQIGAFVTGGGGAPFVAPSDDFSWDRLASYLPDLLHWIGSAGHTLLIGLAIQATATAVFGYLATMLLWRVVVTRLWRSRPARRHSHPNGTP